MASKSASSGLADRYASALFELAEEKGVLDQVADDLRGLKTMVAESADFRRFIDSPVLSRTEQAKGVAALADKAGMQGVTRNFLGLVATNRRLFALPAVIDAFLERLAAKRGEISAEVVSAKPLSDAQTEALAASLKQAVGKDVALETRVDPGLIGGLVVRVGSRMIDNSLRTKLQRLQLAMKGVG
ncbi:ATP synthase delta chain [Caenispirillum salinarum AK4]|uniref:ATP synthase subunit delta n=1 Tax=Caenispirillum salinarum AK4 TaxID=1238182 RepID=K9HWE9_9PROT|nr:F0F1 ATP synthase subunit delta [Caenispirillum salinarum]EKV32541.1 ATP synthase delta chain [Caenispirillum salinarum AK4]